MKDLYQTKNEMAYKGDKSASTPCMGMRYGPNKEKFLITGHDCSESKRMMCAKMKTATEYAQATGGVSSVHTLLKLPVCLLTVNFRIKQEM